MFRTIRNLLIMVFSIMTLTNIAYARDNSDIFDPATGMIISVRQDAFIDTFTYNGNDWRFATSVKGSANFNAITYGDNMYVAVADSSTIWYSTDGTNWSRANGLSGSANFSAVSYGKGTFVAVANMGTIWYSTDGVNWHISNGHYLSYYDPNLTDVIYANGLFIAVGQGYDYGHYSIIYYSSDGISWHLFQPNQTDDGGYFRSVIYADNKYVAVGDSSIIWYSNDGIYWYKATGLNGDANFSAITYHNGIFVAVADKATICYSTDGVNWHIAKGIDENSLSFNDVTYGNGVFVTVGNLNWNTTSTPIWYSKDGISWSPANGIKFDMCYAAIPYFDSVYFDGSGFIATVRDASIDLPEYYSNDGINWNTNQSISNAHRC